MNVSLGINRLIFLCSKGTNASSINKHVCGLTCINTEDSFHGVKYKCDCNHNCPDAQA